MGLSRLPLAVPVAQFNPSKAVDGGADGVRRLAKAVDLGRTLVLRNVDLESLEAADKLPVPLEVDGSRRPLGPRSHRLSFQACSCRLWPSRRREAAAAAVEQQEEAVAPAGVATAGDVAELQGQPSWRQVAKSGADAV